ncbi:MAG: hypothetical protein KAR31_10640, partial [Candidatus Omnitrophica bacterium]|nr:hypothetical protein [Candidatus Omnitrophota bacterium]
VFTFFFAGTGIRVGRTAFFEGFLGKDKSDGHAEKAKTKYKESDKIGHNRSIGELWLRRKQKIIS